MKKKRRRKKPAVLAPVLAIPRTGRPVDAIGHIYERAEQVKGLVVVFLDKDGVHHAVGTFGEVTPVELIATGAWLTRAGLESD